MPTLHDTIATIVAKNPGITSTKITELLPPYYRQKRNSISGTLTHLYDEGTVVRKPSPDTPTGGGRRPYMYYHKHVDAVPTETPEVTPTTDPNVVVGAPSLSMRLVFDAGDEQIEMTFEEARAMYDTLSKLFG